LWFSHDGTGRFDPVGSGRGACYLAEKPLGAWVEVFRQRVLIDDVEVLERALAHVRLGRDIRLADLTSRRALHFGVTASLGANEDYGGSQAFALRALEAGFGGIRYFARHDPSQQLYGIALFGEAEAGAAPAGAHTVSGPIPEELVAEARSRFGYRIVPRP
jgi:hypothetical protein